MAEKNVHSPLHTTTHFLILYIIDQWLSLDITIESLTKQAMPPRRNVYKGVAKFVQITTRIRAGHRLALHCYSKGTSFFPHTMESPLHALELSLWKNPSPHVLTIPYTSIIHGHVENDRYMTTLGNVTFSLPLKWRLILWITSILQHQVVYHAANGSDRWIFTSLVWFYDGLIQHLKEEALKHSFVPEDWSLPAWDRFIVRLRLQIGHSPLALQTSQVQLTKAYTSQPTLWHQGLAITMALGQKA